MDGSYAANNDQAPESNANFSASPVRFNPSETNQQLLFNQQLKQAAYQYHLIYQTKAYVSDVNNLAEISALIDSYLANLNENKYLALPGLIELNKEIEKILFPDKYFLY